MRRVQKASSRPSDGFTLLECLVAVTIVIIIVSNAAPAFYQWFQRQQVVNQTRSIGQLLNIASKQAVQTGRPVYVSAVSGRNWCIRLSHSEKCDCRSGRHCDSVDENAHLQASSSSSYFSASRSQTPLAKFEATHGMSMGFATSLFVSEGPYQGQVILNNLGRIRYCMRPGSGGIPACP